MRHHRVHVRRFPFTRSTAPHLLIASLVPAFVCVHVRGWVCAGVATLPRRRYFLLNAEDYRWQWISFLSSASTALYAALHPARPVALGRSESCAAAASPVRQLSSEPHCSLRPRRYVFIYAVYYFFVKTKMYGFFQTTFYFGYMTMFCLTLAVMCGNRRMFLRTRTAPTDPPPPPPNSRTQTATGSNRRPIAVRGGAGQGRARQGYSDHAMSCRWHRIRRLAPLRAPHLPEHQERLSKAQSERPLLCNPTSLQPSRPSTPAFLCDAEEASGRVRTLGGRHHETIPSTPPAQRQERGLRRGSHGRPMVLVPRIPRPPLLCSVDGVPLRGYATMAHTQLTSTLHAHGQQQAT